MRGDAESRCNDSSNGAEDPSGYEDAEKCHGRPSPKCREIMTCPSERMMIPHCRRKARYRQRATEVRDREVFMRPSRVRDRQRR